jgi:uncharacterized protein YodC (DUF2158 family)
MKFKVGDLVTLSAAGYRVEQNSPVRIGFGIVLSTDKTKTKYPIACQWFNGDRRDYWFKEYELKFFKENS